MFRSHRQQALLGDCFPRVCGDVPPITWINVAKVTFSPRMRGCSDIGYSRFLALKVFPAYAGMFRFHRIERDVRQSFPRVCGDVPRGRWGRRRTRMFSPRMRGCSGGNYAGPAAEIVFPAYAGMFRFTGGLEAQADRFPRVCGDVPRQPPRFIETSRFSPRMRGCSDYKTCSSLGYGVFPAYAGMFL